MQSGQLGVWRRNQGQDTCGRLRVADSGNDRKCNPKTFGTRCHGNSVEYCVGGKIEKYDCKTYFGLNKCVGRPDRHTARSSRSHHVDRVDVDSNAYQTWGLLTFSNHGSDDSAQGSSFGCA